MRCRWFIFPVACVLFLLYFSSAVAQSIAVGLHVAEAGNIAGGQFKTMDYPYVYVDVETAGSWDGALNWEVYGGLAWTSMECTNVYTCVDSSTATISGRYGCELYGSRNFRARISGRTQGTVDVAATFFREPALASVRPCSSSGGGGTSWWTGTEDAITFQPTVDSTAAVRVLDAASNLIFNVNTANDQVEVTTLTSTQFVVDNLTLDGNTISTASTDIILTPGGAGRVRVSQLRPLSGTLYISTSGGSLDINVGSYSILFRAGNVTQYNGATYNGLHFRSNTVSGSIVSGEDLNLESTTHATKGVVNVLDDLIVADGIYAQFEDNNAGAPPSADCDNDDERGRQSIDTTNNRLYICNGATRGWDYIALTD